MPQKSLASIISEAASQHKKEDKIAVLRKYSTPALHMILAVALNPTIKWATSKGLPVFQENRVKIDQDTALYKEIRRLYLFLKPNHMFTYNPNLTVEKRDLLFIQMLEMLADDDAELLLAAKQKRLHVRGLPKETVEEAFPGLITQGIQTKDDEEVA